MANEVYYELKKHFANAQDVTVLNGTGAQGLKFKRKMFCMFTKGYILVKLPQTRVDELIAAGEGLPYNIGKGKLMKNYVIIPETNRKSWVKYCEEAKEFMVK